MAAPVVVPLSPDILVAENYTIRITAIDAATGAAVPGVKVSNVVILGNGTGSQDAPEEPVAQPGTAFAFGDEPA